MYALHSAFDNEWLTKQLAPLCLGPRYYHGGRERQQARQAVWLLIHGAWRGWEGADGFAIMTLPAAGPCYHNNLFCFIAIYLELLFHQLALLWQHLCNDRGGYLCACSSYLSLKGVSWLNGQDGDTCNVMPSHIRLIFFRYGCSFCA